MWGPTGHVMPDAFRGPQTFQEAFFFSWWQQEHPSNSQSDLFPSSFSPSRFHHTATPHGSDSGLFDTTPVETFSSLHRCTATDGLWLSASPDRQHGLGDLHMQERRHASASKGSTLLICESRKARGAYGTATDSVPMMLLWQIMPARITTRAPFSNPFYPVATSMLIGSHKTHPKEQNARAMMVVGSIKTCFSTSIVRWIQRVAF